MAETTNIKVAVRVRPYNRRELEQNQRSIIKVLDGTTLLFDPDEDDDEFFFQGVKQHYRDLTKRVNKKISMGFDRVFDTDTTNRQIFEECTAPLVDAVLNGYNCSVFVYGATGAGKTFTMLGSSEFPGLTFLTMRDLFDKIENQGDMRKFDVGVSYLEVYNEQVMNLLTKTGPLKLREDSNGVVVGGLVLKPIYSAEELLELLALGNANRTQHPTDANAESSRSHAIFQVHIRMTDRKTGTKRTVKLSMIDLAGSERAASTKGVGVRFKEGASINKSLLALGNCINKLADGLKHIPYRDSNLTRILKDSLGGNCRTLMVANVSMSSLTYEDTYNTLKYASRAKTIRTTLKQNAMKSNMPKDFYVKKVNELMAEVERLRESNKSLEAKVAACAKSQSSGGGGEYNEAELKPWYTRIDGVYARVIAAQEHVCEMQSKIKTSALHKRHKEQLMSYNKMLALCPSEYKEQVSMFSSWVDSHNKTTEKQMEELSRRRKVLQATIKELDALKREVKESKYKQILTLYRKSKDLEQQNSMKAINTTHITNINSEVLAHTRRMTRAFSLACGLLKASYESLDAETLLLVDSRNSYERLLNLINAQSLLDTMAMGNERHGDTAEAITPKKRRLIVNHGGDSDASSVLLNTTVAVSAGKRRHNANSTFVQPPPHTDEDHDDDDDDDEEVYHDENYHLDVNCIVDDTDLDGSDGGDASSSSLKSNNNNFKVPSIVLDSTHVVADHGADDATPATSGTRAANNRHHLISNILSEQIAKVPNNTAHLKSILVKSKNFSREKLLKTVAAGVQKENKRFSPHRVRKSPRSIASKAAVTSTGGAAQPAARRLAAARLNADGGAMVRINRAASFRFKK